VRAAYFSKRGDPLSDILVVRDVERPVPKAGQVLVKIVAAAMNPVDWKMVDGSFPILARKGLMGVDSSGVVEDIPAGTTTDLEVGDKVYCPHGEFTPGAFAEYAAVAAEQVHRVPANISMREAAALPTCGLTALQALTKTCAMKAGDKVFIGGGSGGVGSLAVQLAASLGASEIWSTGSKGELIESLGATKVVNYREEDVVEALAGQSFDLMFDTVGTLDSWLAAKQGALAPTGKYTTTTGDGVGGIGRLVTRTAWRTVLNKIGLGPNYSFFAIKTAAPHVVEDMAKLTARVEAGDLEPLLFDEDYELSTEGLRAMLKQSMSGHTTGKLVMTIAPS